MNSPDQPTFRLLPKKVVFCVPDQDGLKAERVVVHRHTLVYSATGEEIGFAQQLVEALLNSEAARQRFGSDGRPEHKGFFLELRFTGAELGSICLKKLEPSVLRPIELIQVNGSCKFEPQFFALRKEKQADVRVVWITGPRKKRIVRFGIRSAGGSLCSSVWKCETEVGRAKSDLYLIPQGMGSAFKISLHESGEWHMGFTSEYAARPNAIYTRNKAGRHWEVWDRPEPIGPGVTRAFTVVIPSSAARMSRSDENSPISWVAAPPSGQAIEFNVILTNLPIMPAGTWPGKDSMNTGLAGSFQLENGETAWVVYREIKAPRFKDIPIPAEAFEAAKLEDDVNLTIALMGKADDGSRFVFEAPLDVSEVRRGLSELAKRKEKHDYQI